MEITIRRIETESIEDKGIFETLFIEYLSGFSVELDLSVIDQLFALPYFHGFISFVDDKPAGFGKHRSKGYGAELMHALKTEAQKSLTTHISWTASPHNTKAHEFYKKLGAEVERMDGQRPYFRWAMYG
ncbi:GNAT family N-acetyltransferase [Vibrio owensii]|uniref:GNAT family N-acetyltransferase n=1 Tax=Vibrio owensii TaxID=696485 RepID=UPI004068AE13